MLHIKFDNIKIDKISDSSGVFAGDNIIMKWKAVSISHSGYGTLSGNNNVVDNGKSIVIKEDPSGNRGKDLNYDKDDKDAKDK